MIPDTSKITLVTEATVDAKQWQPEDSNGTPPNAPIILLSDAADATKWVAFAEIAGKSGEVNAVWELTPYTIAQTIWAVGEPCTLISLGQQPGLVALNAANLAKGGVRSLVLVDFGLIDDQILPPTTFAGSVLLLRGRQSAVADHQSAVVARSKIGEKCRLVELENCADNAPESCPRDFATAVDWFLRGEATD